MKRKDQLPGKVLFLIFFLLHSVCPAQSWQGLVYEADGVFTVPPGISRIKVEAWGAGGGGGGAGANAQGKGGGGGGGAYAMKILDVSEGEVYQVLIGQGGSGGIGDAIGSTGGASEFFVNASQPLVKAAGGRFGSPAAVTSGGLGGQYLECVGDLIYSGGKAINGGGGASGSSGRGGDAVGTAGGAGAPDGGGNGADCPEYAANGNNGLLYGGGGSGAAGYSPASFNGGNGANGKIVVTYLLPPEITSQPLDQEIIYGNSADFSVQVSSQQAVTFQWQINEEQQWTDLDNETSNELHVPNPDVSMSGKLYRCLVYDDVTYAESDPARLIVNKAPLIVTNVEIQDKCFDGTTTAITTGILLSGIITGDNVITEFSGLAFADAAPGPDIPLVYSSVILSGEDAANYFVEEIACQLNANIFSLPQMEISVNGFPVSEGTVNICPCDNFEVAVQSIFSGTLPFNVQWKTYHDDILNTSGSSVVSSGGDVIFNAMADENRFELINVQDANGCIVFSQQAYGVSVQDVDNSMVSPVTFFEQEDINGLCDGEIFNVDVRVLNFSNIGSINLTLEYDPDMLEFSGFESVFDVAGNNFQVSANLLEGQGIISVSAYVDDSESLMSLQDNAALLTLSFIYNFSGQGTSFLSWYHDPANPVYNQYSSGPPDYIPLCAFPFNEYFIDAELSGQLKPELSVALDKPGSAEDAPEYCFNEIVSLYVDEFVSGTPPFTIEWEVSNGQEVVDSLSGSISGVSSANSNIFTRRFPPGEFQIAITSVIDESGCLMNDNIIQNLTESLIVYPEPVIQITSFMTPGSNYDYEICHDEPFAIQLQGVSGGQEWLLGYIIAGPDNYNNNGAIQTVDGQAVFSLDNLSPGTYYFSVTELSDENCSSVNLDVYSFDFHVYPEPSLSLGNNSTFTNAENDFEYLYGSTVSVFLDEIAMGTPPFDFLWTVNGGPQENSAHGINENEDLFSAVLEPGEYLFEFTSVADANGCSPDAQDMAAMAFTIIVHPAAVVSGNVYYHHKTLQQTNLDIPLENVRIKLFKDGAEHYSVLSDQNGFYRFENVLPGDYEMHIENTMTTCGINVTDAAMVNYWSIASSQIEKAAFYAGDVTGLAAQGEQPVPDNKLLSNDASMIQDYFQSFIGFEFPRGQWSFWPKGETISENPVESLPGIVYPVLSVAFGELPPEKDFYGLITGDFNRSYQPITGREMPGRISLVSKGEILAGADDIIAVPLLVADSLMAGAVSLVLDIPSQNFEVSGVFLNKDSCLIPSFTVSDNLLRIGWYGLEPLELLPLDTLLTLELTTTAPAEDTLLIKISENPLNEFADEFYNVIPGVELMSPAIIPSSALTVEEGDVEGLKLRVFPNPSAGSAEIYFILPSSGNIILDITDIQGRKIFSMNDHFEAGNHKYKIEEGLLGAGAYAITLVFESRQKTGRITEIFIRN